MSGIFVLGLDLAGPANREGTAAAPAARDWSRGRTRWLRPAEPPAHPFDYAC